MVVSTQSRNEIVEKLKREIIGPDPFGRELDFSKPVIFKNKTDSYQSFVQQGTGEEILQRDSPLTRYGSAILYGHQPEQKDQKSKIDSDSIIKKLVFGDDGEIVRGQTKSGKNFEGAIPQAKQPQTEISGDIILSDIPDLTSANKVIAHAMGISFLAEITNGSQIIVQAKGGRYHMSPAIVEKQKKTWWRRESVGVSTKFNIGQQYSDFGKSQSPDRKWKKLKSSKFKTVNSVGLDLSIEAHARPTEISNQFLVTVQLVNRTKILSGKMPDLFALFQSEFSVRVVSRAGNRNIMPYEAAGNSSGQLSDEEQSLALLYRNARTFAIGHGCAADWDREVAVDGRVLQVTANHFPVFDVPRMTSEITGADGQPIEISMAKLAGLVPTDNGLHELSEMVGEYESWIDRKETESLRLAPQYRRTAMMHLEECRSALERMKYGLILLNEDERVREAWRLTNLAMLMQQHQVKTKLRQASIDSKTGGAKYATSYSKPDLLDPNSHLGKWRAFQIGFLLMSLRSAIDPDCPERETVELIWFATGGGKTEAYSALAAFAIFYRRLVDPNDAGTAVFLRYTLRLLTSQQFQRAGALICAMDVIRRKNPEKLGATEFSIGLWLGNEATPGSRHDARRSLRQLEKFPRTTENKFVLNRCPYCAAELGKIEGDNNGGKQNAVGDVSKQCRTDSGKDRKSKKNNGKNRQSGDVIIAGYKFSGGQVILHCPDKTCPFHDFLPILVSDEQLYDRPPTIFIATVDKFAILAWKPEAKLLFGFNKNGERIFSPPGLIIQDELHLITSALGSIVGLYEPVIEELCTDRRIPGKTIRPKIVASTATTRGYHEQILNLYGRTDARLFPPPGLSADDSFFAAYARDENNRLLPGRLYVGVSAAGLGSVQNTEVRVYTALLQAANQLPDAEKNWFWTLMIFFNNLRWLGNTVSLFQANLPSYSLAYHSRFAGDKQSPPQASRRIKSPLELTGQLSGDEILSALKKLETDWTPPSSSSGSQAVDACLCSSIAEVGVDVGRISLMAVVGQPKSVSQYIQVTSRVGRDVQHPGLVVTIFSPYKSRDVSYFEKFRSCHEKLYAQVEPASVTPFAPPVLERALHAVITSYVRQFGSRRESLTPYPVPEQLIAECKNMMLERIEKAAPEMRGYFERIFERRINEWRRWEQTLWTPDPRAGGNGSSLLRSPDRWVDEREKNRSWATPISMRSVDSESELRVTDYYRTRQLESAKAEVATKTNSNKNEETLEEILI